MFKKRGGESACRAVAVVEVNVVFWFGEGNRGRGGGKMATRSWRGFLRGNRVTSTQFTT